MSIVETLVNKYQVSLTEQSKAKLGSIFTRKEFAREEMILEQSQISQYFYIVEQGLIRQFYYKDGRDITEHFSQEGDVAACIESLFLKCSTHLMIEALEPSAVYLVKRSDWIELSNHDLSINELYRSVIERKLIVSQRKADSWRFESSHERYERFCKEYPSIAKRAPIAHIASYLLMAPETLSRLRAGDL